MRAGRWGVLMVVVLAAACEQLGLEEKRFQPLRDDTLSWENPQVPWEQWERDRSECRVLALDRAERDFARAREAMPPVDYSRTREYQISVDRFEARRREQTLFERCMTSRGYRAVPRTQQESGTPPAR